MSAAYQEPPATRSRQPELAAAPPAPACAEACAERVTPEVRAEALAALSHTQAVAETAHRESVAHFRYCHELVRVLTREFLMMLFPECVDRIGICPLLPEFIRGR